MIDAFVLPRYAISLGIAVDRTENGAPLLVCDPAEEILGRPGFWHGGAIGGLLEMAALAAAATAPRSQGQRIRAANVTMQFIRGAEMKQTYALGRVERSGRRLLYLRADAWQEDRTRPIASATMNVLLLAED